MLKDKISLLYLENFYARFNYLNIVYIYKLNCLRHNEKSIYQDFG
jgi:hypothetical protein